MKKMFIVLVVLLMMVTEAGLVHGEEEFNNLICVTGSRNEYYLFDLDTTSGLLKYNKSVTTDLKVAWAEFSDSRNGDILVGIGNGKNGPGYKVECNKISLYTNQGKFIKDLYTFSDTEPFEGGWRNASFNGEYLALDVGIYKSGKLIKSLEGRNYGLRFYKNILYYLHGGGLGRPNKILEYNLENGKLTEINLGLGFVEEILSVSEDLMVVADCGFKIYKAIKLDSGWQVTPLTDSEVYKIKYAGYNTKCMFCVLPKGVCEYSVGRDDLCKPYIRMLENDQMVECISASGQENELDLIGYETPMLFDIY